MKKIMILVMGVISLCFAGGVFADSDVPNDSGQDITHKLDTLYNSFKESNDDLTVLKSKVNDFILNELITDNNVRYELMDNGSLDSVVNKGDDVFITYVVKTGSHDNSWFSIRSNEHFTFRLGSDNVDRLVELYDKSSKLSFTKIGHIIVMYVLIPFVILFILMGVILLLKKLFHRMMAF